MGYASDKDIEEREKKEKWVTKKCCYCGENTPVRVSDLGEPIYCEYCWNKLFSKEALSKD